jgi:predicted outer membrane repeat protein
MRSATPVRSACLLLMLGASIACGDKDDPQDDTGDTGPVDADGDGVLADEDCDDGDPAVGAPSTWYADADGDGFGDPDASEEACPGEAGLVDNFYDCDDGDPAMPLLVDQATGSAGGSGSAADPIDTIATAIAAGPGCIVVGPGSYTGSIEVSTDLILGSLEGAASTTIDAGGAGSVVEVTDGSLSIGGFTLTGGTGSTALGDQSLGGAIQAWGAMGLRIEDCVLTGNTAQYGGGVFGPEKGETTIVDSSFTDNVAETTGGGFYLGSAVIEGSDFSGNQAAYGGGGYLTVGAGSAEASTFEGNDATQGGGLYVADEGSFAGGTYTGNSAEKGGGVYLDESTSFSGGTIEANDADRGGGVDMETGASLSDSVIRSNTATTYGGGLHAAGEITLAGLDIEANSATSLGGGALLASGSMDISDLDCIDNEATSSGGCLYVHESNLSVTGLVLQGNSAEFGGGAALASSTVDTRTGTATIELNTATTYGGGVHFDGSGGWFGGTFSANEALHGGGIFVAGLTAMEGVTFDANVATGNGGGVLANAMFGLTDGAITGNSAQDGAGLFVAAGTSTLLATSVVQANNAGGAGGGARVEGELESDACDWGTAGTDNAPQDVYAAGGDYDWDGAASFTCSGTGGCS